MNALYGVPDVKEMQYHRTTLKLVPHGGPGLCESGLINCRFVDSPKSTCGKYCSDEHIWIRESQMPEYLAARLLEGAV